ncbi:PREDICTED: developmental pluripotency-associated protein 3-like [Ceratotherium simum simum]|uniref:Developmental pluripotency-associated protein 3-like n=1 Tax=Ceratotherium simum simum TaxID=73337 RepID=A0ABM1C8L2_CERSS|nr:PREDICTED: developmental pluripotency-associated protein 3-like [Ceratotherium simum simum]
MDSSKLNPAWTLGSSQMPSEENSQEDSAATSPISKALMKNLSNLTLNPSTKFHPPSTRTSYGILYRRSGVRTLLTAQKERMQRMIQIIKCHHSNQLPVLPREPRQKKTEVESRIQRFRCRCHYCLYHRDLSENTSMENSYDTESIEP